MELTAVGRRQRKVGVSVPRMPSICIEIVKEKI